MILEVLIKKEIAVENFPRFSFCCSEVIILFLNVSTSSVREILQLQYILQWRYKRQFCISICTAFARFLWLEFDFFVGDTQFFKWWFLSTNSKNIVFLLLQVEDVSWTVCNHSMQVSSEIARVIVSNKNSFGCFSRLHCVPNKAVSILR